MNQINLIRSPTGYRNFIKAFRAFRNLPAGSVVQVRDQESGRIFFFRMPNWEMFAYRLPGGIQQNLVNYHYPNNFSNIPVGTREIAGAFVANYQLVIENNLTIILFLTSEAARSQLIYLQFQEIFNSPKRFLERGGINFFNLSVLVHNYDGTAKYLRYINPSGQYSVSWRPLEYEDYMHYFVLGKNPLAKEKLLQELSRANSISS